MIVIAFLLSSITGLGTYALAGCTWRDETRNLVALSGFTGNAGFFGIPVLLALLGVEWVGLYLIITLGILFAEITLGYYLGARGHWTVRDAFMKLLRFPVLYGAVLGVAFSFSGFGLTEGVRTYWQYFYGAWAIMGMMLIGIGLSSVQALKFDGTLWAWFFVPRFLVSPLLALGFVALDVLFFQAYSYEIYMMFALMFSVPMAASMVAYAETLNLYPQRTATAVLVSTFLGILTVPATMHGMQLLLQAL